MGAVFLVVQWGYGESVTEESDGILDLVDSCLEVRRDLVVAKQFFLMMPYMPVLQGHPVVS